MHASKADLPAMVIGEYDGRTVDWSDFRVLRTDNGKVELLYRGLEGRPGRGPIPNVCLGMRPTTIA